MGHELICSWLGLSPETWPPDHYRLLGLAPGEDDLALIEQRVHQRVDAVRRYQMMHPEQATEAMNRLAQAFVCLTEPGSKRAYDDQLLGARPRSAPPPLPVAAPPPPPVVLAPPPLPAPPDPFVWMYTRGMNGPGDVPPPPVRVPMSASDLPPPLVRVPPLPTAEPAAPVAVAEPPPPAPPPTPIDSIVFAARRSPQARRGLGTRRQLLQRIYRTRHLLRLWHRMKPHLDDPDRKLTRPEATELYKLVGKVEEAIDEFPLLGEAGQPGYLIVSLNALEKAKELLTLTYAQRESLQRDWHGGLKFLTAHRDYLRTQAAARRRRGRLRRTADAIAATFADHPLSTLLIVAGAVTALIAVLRSLE